MIVWTLFVVHFQGSAVTIPVKVVIQNIDLQRTLGGSVTVQFEVMNRHPDTLCAFAQCQGIVQWTWTIVLHEVSTTREGSQSLFLTFSIVMARAPDGGEQAPVLSQLLGANQGYPPGLHANTV